MEIAAEIAGKADAKIRDTVSLTQNQKTVFGWFQSGKVSGVEVRANISKVDPLGLAPGKTLKLDKIKIDIFKSKQGKQIIDQNVINIYSGGK